MGADSSLLTPRARAAWKAIEPKLRRRGVFWDGRAGGQFELFVLVEAYSAYRMTRDEAARLTGRQQRRILREAEAIRLQVRALAAKFFDLIPAARVPLTPVDADGEDTELMSWFTPETRRTA